MVFEFIQRGAQRLGDMPLATGDTTGAIKYCKVGDAIIEMGSESAAPGQRIVIEAKEDASYNLGKARIEIETARKNRGASVGVFVFSKKSAPIGQEPLLRHGDDRSEEHTSELQSRGHLVCRLLLEKKNREQSGKRLRSSHRF